MQPSIQFFLTRAHITACTHAQTSIGFSVFRVSLQMLLVVCFPVKERVLRCLPSLRNKIDSRRRTQSKRQTQKDIKRTKKHRDKKTNEYSEEDLTNRAMQRWHLKGSSRSCTISCNTNFCFMLNFTLHTLQLWLLRG